MLSSLLGDDPHRPYSGDTNANAGGPERRGNRIVGLCLPSLADLFFLCPFLFLAFHSGSHLLNDGDTGYHVRAGEYMIRNLTVPRFDIFSYIDPPLAWTAHEWLSEVVMALVHGLSGLTGLTIFFAVLIGTTYRLLFRFSQSLDCNLAATVLLVLFATASSPLHWLARPHIFSLVLTVVWYAILENYQRGRKDRLLALPLLMLLWANLHGGFVMGLLLLAVYGAANLAASVVGPAFKRHAARQRLNRLAMVGGSCLFACLLNPRGYALLLFPFTLVSNRFIMDNVSEFLSPNFHHALPYKYFLLFSIGLVSISRKRLDLIELTLLLLFTYMSLYSARYIPLFAIVATPILLRQVQASLQASSPVVNFFETRSRNLQAIDARAKSGWWPVLSVLVVSALALAGKIQFNFPEADKPIAAVEFLKRENLAGKMFNDDEFGDYLIYAAWPQYKVFFDGRSDMYGERWGGEYTKVVRLHPDWEQVLERHGCSWIFLPARSPLAVVLLRHDNWQLIYADTVAHVFVKKIPEYAGLLAKYPNVKPAPASAHQS
jgi:hypothetical protein